MSSKVARNALAQYGFVAARYLFPFLTLPYLARVLGPEGYAVRAYIVSFMLFAQTIADFGFGLSGARAVVLARKGGGDWQRVAADILTAKTVMICVVGVTIFVITFFVPILKCNVLALSLSFGALVFGGLVPDFVFSGFENMGLITVRFVFVKLLTTVLILVLTDSSSGVFEPFLYELIGSIVSFILAWVMVVRGYGFRFEFAASWGWVHAFRGAVPYFTSTVSVAALNSLATIVVGIRAESDFQVACWALAITGLNAVLALYNPIANALFPHMVRSGGFVTYRRFFWGGGMGAIACTSLLVLFSVEIVWVLGGEAYLGGEDIIVWLAPVAFFAYPALMFGAPLLGAKGYEGLLSYTALLTAGVYCVALIGVALSSSFSLGVVASLRVGAEFMLACLRGFYARRKFGSYGFLLASRSCS